MSIIFSWQFSLFSEMKWKTGSFSRDLEMYHIWWDRNFFHSWNSNNRPQLDQNLCQITSAQNILPNTVSEQFNDKKWPSPKFANTTWFSNDNWLHLSLVKKDRVECKRRSSKEERWRLSWLPFITLRSPPKTMKKRRNGPKTPVTLNISFSCELMIF